MKAHGEYMMALDEELRESGEHVDGQGLTGPEQAMIVRAQDSCPPAVSDGPFPEAMEFLAGYWIIDVDSPGRAIEIAARASAAPGRDGAPINTPFEVRPLMTPPLLLQDQPAPLADSGEHQTERDNMGRVAEALRICLRPEHLRRTLKIALVVGTILSLINQSDVIIGGDATVGTWIKVGLNYCVPFVVSNLGLLAGKRAEVEREMTGL